MKFLNLQFCALPVYLAIVPCVFIGILLFMSKVGNSNKNNKKNKVSPKLVFNEKGKIKKKCYLFVIKDNASQIACLVFGENN